MGYGKTLDQLRELAEAMHSSDHLMPCPFCGTEPTVKAQECKRFFVGCQACGCRGPAMKTTNEALTNWNKRWKSK